MKEEQQLLISVTDTQIEILKMVVYTKMLEYKEKGMDNLSKEMRKLYFHMMSVSLAK